MSDARAVTVCCARALLLARSGECEHFFIGTRPVMRFVEAKQTRFCDVDDEAHKRGG